MLVSMEEIKRNHTGNFFNSANMRHMQTRLGKFAKRNDADSEGFFFITSEVISAGSRVYTVRFLTAGRVVTVGPHLQRTKREAEAALELYVSLRLPSRFWKVFNIIDTFIRAENYDDAAYWVEQGGGKLLTENGLPAIAFPEALFILESFEVIARR